MDGIIFTVLKRRNKYVIGYIEKGKITYLNKYSFDSESDAQTYLITNKDAIVAEEVARRAEIEAEKEEKRRKKEEKRTRKEEKKRVRTEKRTARKEKTKDFFKKSWVRFVSGAVAMAIFLVGGHWVWVGISNLVEKNKKPSSSQVGNTDPTETTVPSTLPIESDELTNEKFEEITAEFGKIIKDAEINLETDDVVEFATIINFDKLCKENPELAKNLIGEQISSEYLSEVFKVLGQISQHNYDSYNIDSETRGTTNGFIKVSDVLAGKKDKETMIYYESLLNEMAVVANSEELSEEDKKEKINVLAKEFCDSVDKLSEDDGFGVGLYMIAYDMLNVVSRNLDGKCYLNEVNEKKLIRISHLETYISNIKNKYNELQSNISCSYSYTSTYNNTYDDYDTLSSEHDNIYTSYTRGLRL